MAEGHKLELEFDGGSTRVKVICPDPATCGKNAYCGECRKPYPEDVDPDEYEAEDLCDCGPKPSGCILQPWGDEGTEYLEGKVALDVVAEWDMFDEGPTLHVSAPHDPTAAMKAMMYDASEECRRLHIGTDRWCLRISKGRLSRHGEWKPKQYCVFLVLRGKRWPS